MAVVLYQQSEVTPESSLIPRTRLKALDTAKYTEQQIHAYRKPVKKSEPALKHLSEKGQDTTKIPMKDFVWETAHASGDEDSSIPAWSGFNALVSTKRVPVARIRYLPFINASPSDLSTIFTTLLRLVEISNELGQPHILVTADLAIYSIAKHNRSCGAGPSL